MTEQQAREKAKAVVNEAIEDHDAGGYQFAGIEETMATKIAAALLEASKPHKDPEPLVEALEYYADPMNYSVDYDTSQMGFSRRCILYGDIEERNEATGLAGQRARTALEQWNKGEKK